MLNLSLFFAIITCHRRGTGGSFILNDHKNATASLCLSIGTILTSNWLLKLHARLIGIAYQTGTAKGA